MKRKLSFDEIDQIKSLDQMKLNRQKAPSVHGVGVNDVDFFVKVGGKKCTQYSLWQGLLERCHNVGCHKRQPTYTNCSVSDEWVYFSNFLVWCNNQTGYSMKDGKGNSFDLDKDIVNKGNKVYSSENCSFVPAAINTLLTKSNNSRGGCPIGVCFNKSSNKYQASIGIEGKLKYLGLFITPEEAFLTYKTAKEVECKRIANLYKDVISPLVYEALMNYTVEIDD